MMYGEHPKWIEYTYWAKRVCRANDSLQQYLFEAFQDIDLKSIEPDKRPILYAACKTCSCIDEEFFEEWLEWQNLTGEEYAQELNKYHEASFTTLAGKEHYLQEVIFYLAADSTYLNGRTTEFDFDVFDDQEKYLSENGSLPYEERRPAEFVQFAEWMNGEEWCLWHSAMNCLGFFALASLPKEKRTEFYIACRRCGISKRDMWQFIRTCIGFSRKDALKNYTDILTNLGFGKNCNTFNEVSGSFLFKIADVMLGLTDYIDDVRVTDYNRVINREWNQYLNNEKREWRWLKNTSEWF